MSPRNALLTATLTLTCCLGQVRAARAEVCPGSSDPRAPQRLLALPAPGSPFLPPQTLSAGTNLARCTLSPSLSLVLEHPAGPRSRLHLRQGKERRQVPCAVTRAAPAAGDFMERHRCQAPDGHGLVFALGGPEGSTDFELAGRAAGRAVALKATIPGPAPGPCTLLAELRPRPTGWLDGAAVLLTCPAPGSHELSVVIRGGRVHLTALRHGDGDIGRFGSLRCAGWGGAFRCVGRLPRAFGAPGPALDLALTRGAAGGWRVRGSWDDGQRIQVRGACARW